MGKTHRENQLVMTSSLSWLCQRIAELLPLVDARAPTGRVSRRTGSTYLPGVASLDETGVRDLLVETWITTTPEEFEPVGLVETEVPYPGLARARCDMVLSSAGWSSLQPEWAIELKRIQFVGDNGKNNDFNVQKMLSPYLKDRSLIHDIERMRTHPIASRHAVIGYAFSYDFKTCADAISLHPSEHERIANIREVCKKNDSINGTLSSDALISAADLYFTSKKVVVDRAVAPFSDVWHHPCGGVGNIFGWEVA